MQYFVIMFIPSGTSNENGVDTLYRGYLHKYVQERTGASVQKSTWISLKKMKNLLWWPWEEGSSQQVKAEFCGATGIEVVLTTTMAVNVPNSTQSSISWVFFTYVCYDVQDFPAQHGPCWECWKPGFLYLGNALIGEDFTKKKKSQFTTTIIRSIQDTAWKPNNPDYGLR